MAKRWFGLSQITKLKEIQKARLKKDGVGIHAEVQELIDRLESGGVGAQGENPFLVQSKCLWDLRWGRELGHRTTDRYRKSLEAEGLVVTPTRPHGLPAHLDRLVLWDLRPLLVKRWKRERVSIVKTCRLCSVAYGGDDNTLIQHEATPVITTPVRWVWCQDGRMHRHRKPSDCRTSFVPPEVGAEALTGLFLYAQNPTVIGGEDNHVMDLPGSVLRDVPSGCAFLGVWSDGPGLYWRWHGDANSHCGSGSRWE